MPNSQRNFDEAQQRKLGQYVYGLIDPRDSKVFYVGQGSRDRVFSHFGEAEDAQRNKQGWTAKTRRISEIWEQDLDVTWSIFRRALNEIEADHVEAAILGALSVSQNGSCLNINAGNGNNNHGLLMSDETNELAAPPVNPGGEYHAVFIFNITNALSEGRSAYDATRCCWNVTEAYRNEKNAIAVGLRGGISQGVFRIGQWEEEGEKWKFTGEDTAAELNAKNFLQIINSVRGYWQRGQYLVVQFNGKGKYRILRGNPDHDTWHSLGIVQD